MIRASIRGLSCLALAAMLAACNRPAATSNVLTTPASFTSKFQPLADSLLLDSAAVRNYLKLLQSDPIEGGKAYTLANQAFLLGTDLLVNQNKPGEALATFRNSIAIYPTSDGYVMFAKAYTAADYEQRAAVAENLRVTSFKLPAQNGWDSAPVSALLLAKLLGYPDLAELHWQVVRALAPQIGEGSPMTALLHHAQIAVSMGFEADTTALATDAAFNTIRTWNEPWELFATRLMEMRGQLSSKADSLRFQTFLQLFGSPLAPGDSLTLTPDRMDSLPSTRSLPFSFARYVPGMESVEFGRGVSMTYFPVALLRHDSLTLLLFRAEEFTMGPMLRTPQTIYAATYRRDGKLLDTVSVAGVQKPTQVFTYRWTGGAFRVDDWQLQYDKPVGDDLWYEPENDDEAYPKVTAETRLRSHWIVVQPDGKFLRTDSPPSAGGRVASRR